MPIFIVDETDEVKHPPRGHKASDWRGQDPIWIVIFTYYSCSKRVEVIWIRNVPEHMLPTAGLHCRMISPSHGTVGFPTYFLFNGQASICFPVTLKCVWGWIPWAFGDLCWMILNGMSRYRALDGQCLIFQSSDRCFLCSGEGPHAVRGNLVPPPGTELESSALEMQCFNYWTTRGVLISASFGNRFKSSVLSDA